MLETREVLFYFSMKYKGDWNQIYHAISTKERIDEEEYLVYKKECKTGYITILDELFPIEWKRIYRPPFVIYYKGDISILKDSKKLAVVGARNPKPYYVDIARTLSLELSKEDVTLISGMAKGIDTIVHESAFITRGRTIAILGSGIEEAYPKSNKELYKELSENHLVMSEYPSHTPIEKSHFPFRNRLIVGLAQGLLAIEVHKKSGTGISIQYALEQNISIFCPPSPFRDLSMNNLLIRQGAILCEQIDDIFEELNWQKKK